MPDLSEIKIRRTLEPGDIGYIIHLHGNLYQLEFGYGIPFEAYVARGLLEFYEGYNPENEATWICEYGDRIIGSLLLKNRGISAQLRYFIIHPSFRGIGLGKFLMQEFIKYLPQHNYKSAYLWTNSDLNTAAALYQRSGFIISEEKESSVFGKKVIEQKYFLNVAGMNG